MMIHSLSKDCQLRQIHSQSALSSYKRDLSTLKCASKKIGKKSQFATLPRNSKLEKVSQFNTKGLRQTVVTQATSQTSNAQESKRMVNADVKMLLTLNKYAPSVTLSQRLRLKIRARKSLPKKTQKPSLIISIPFDQELEKPSAVQPLNEQSICQSKRSLTVSICLQDTPKSDEI